MSTDLKKRIDGKADFRELFAALYPDHYREHGNCRCPFHDDHNASFQLDERFGYCHAGCKTQQGQERWDHYALWMKRYGCSFSDAAKGLARYYGISRNGSARRHKRNAVSKLIETSDYHDESGASLFQVCRYEPKAFRQRRPDGNGGYIWKLDDVRRVLFHLPELIQADSDKPVLLVEGERDVLSAERIGMVATTNPGGAGKWDTLCEKYSIHVPLENRMVWVIPDNDDAGRAHAGQIAGQLHGWARSVKIIELPDLPEKGDLTDFVEKHGHDEAKRLILELGEAAQEYEPADTESASERVEEPREIIHNAIPRLQQRDTAIIDDTAVLDAMVWARGVEPALYDEAIDAARGKRGIVRELETAIRSRSLRVATPEDDATTTVADALGAIHVDPPPGTEGLVIPPPYLLDQDGTGYQRWTDDGIERVPVAPALILPAKRHINVTSGEEEAELVYRERGRWRTLIAPREICVDSRRVIPGTASRGYPVGSVNSRAVAKYHFDFLTSNAERLGIERTSAAMGWVDAGDSPVFLWGAFQIAGEDAKRVTFRAADIGDQQIADAFRASGTLDEWMRVIEPAMRYPRVRLLVYAALAAPCLRIFDTTNFVVDVSSRTSTGKTSALRGAGSVWGRADERAHESVTHTWDTTRVGAERLCAISCDLPVILDDTKRGSPRVVNDVLYSAVSGHGRTRGSVQGLRDSGTWRTILLSSGEAAAVSYTENAGVRARVLTIRGLPFGTDTGKTRTLINELNRGLQQHYGHAGPSFIRWLVENRDRWDEFRRMFHDRADQFSAGSGVKARLSDAAATISVAGRLAHEALSLPWDFQCPFDDLWPDIEAEAADADIDIRALRAVMSWAYGHQRQFYVGADDGGSGEPVGGWAGVWTSSDDWDTICFLPHVLRDILRQADYDHAAVLQGWLDRGWLELPKTGTKRTVLRKIARKATRVFAIKRAAVKAAEGDAETDNADINPSDEKSPGDASRQDEPMERPANCAFCDHALDDGRCGVHEFTRAEGCAQFKEAQI